MTMQRDSRGRFSKGGEKTNWGALAVVLLFVAAVCTVGYLIPTWVSDIQKESYDAGFASGDSSGFNEGLAKGFEYYGWNRSGFLYNVWCNSTLCRSLDSRYNTRWEYSLTTPLIANWSYYQ